MKFIANGSISQSVSLSKQKKLDKTLARVCQLLERYSANFLALFPDFCIIFEYFHSRPLHRRVIFFCNFSCSRFFTRPLFPFINYFLVCSGKLLLFVLLLKIFLSIFICNFSKWIDILISSPNFVR